MAKVKRTYLYCYASGLAKFGPKIPKGALPIDSRTHRQLQAERARIKKQKAAGVVLTDMPWKDRMRTRMRLGYDGSMLVPGIPEAADQTEALYALFRFKKWAVEK